MSGRWIGPDNTDALLAVVDELNKHGANVQPADFIIAIWRTGLLVHRAYYVPDADELLDAMRNWQYHMRRGGVECRWVMCRETLDALARRWERKVAPMPATFDSAWWASGAGDDLPPAALGMEVERVIEYQQRHWSDKARLFGVPVRIDPAARSPLFEIDSPATDTKPAADYLTAIRDTPAEGGTE